MSKLRVVILGTMGRCPFGGHVWVHLNWLRGFHRLGHDVWYVEDDTVWPYNPREQRVSDDCSYAVHHISEWMTRIGLRGHWAFRLADRIGACWGLSEIDLDGLYRSADVLVNMAGATLLRDPQLAARNRVLLHTDPVTAEVRLANGDEFTRSAFAQHDFIVTYGENYGKEWCRVPLNGLERKYRISRQAIDLDCWPMSFNEEARYFTTIGNWRQEGNDVSHLGEIYRWSKHHEWEKFTTLPARTKQEFEVALQFDNPDDRTRLQAGGWNPRSPISLSLDVFGEYRSFIQKSRAEWTVAKDQNIRFRSGWFSDRDATYLASGKPVVAQDTGFGDNLPTGLGLFSFRTLDDVLSAIETINSAYLANCEAAREIAREFFECRKLAARLLSDLGLA